MVTSVLSLLVRSSAGSDGILSIATELLELVVVMVSVAAAIFSRDGTLIEASVFGNLLSVLAVSLLATLALHFFH